MSTVKWIPAAWISVDDELPDDDETVLIWTSDGEPWTGYHGFNNWYYVSGDKLSAGRVTHWMPFPDGPCTP